MDWITDRVPTEADADCVKDVAVKQRPTSDGFAYLHWGFVKPGMAWRRTGRWAAPEPAALTSQPRRIVSISRTVYGATHTIDAVADDGTAWWKVPGEAAWKQLPALPDKE